MLNSVRIWFAAGCMSALTVTVACSTMDEPSDTSSESVASAKTVEPITTLREAAVVPQPNAPLSQDQDTLVSQKRALLLETAMNNATAMLESGDYEAARAQLEHALEIDPANADATAQYMQVLELLGERHGQIETVRRVAEDRSRVRRESMRSEAEEYHRLAQEARARGDYEEAIRFFERVSDSIRWSSLDVDWGELKARNEDALQTTRNEQADANEALRQEQLSEAFDRIQDDERKESELERQRVATILERAAYKFDRGDFDAAIEMADEALAIDGGNRTAVDLREKSLEARRGSRSANYAEDKKQAFRRWIQEIDELRIPYSDGLTAASDDYWANVLKRTPISEIGIENKSPEDARIRELLKSTSIREISFEDDEITTVTTVLQSFSDIPVLATPEVISELESSGELITLPSLTHLSVEAIMNIIASNLGETVSWTVRNGVAMFTTTEEAFGETIVRVHPISDLTFPLTNFKGPQIDHISLPGEYGDEPETSVFAADLEGEVIIEPESIENLIRENVARESWELGDDRFSIASTPQQIVVVHTPEVHEEIANFLNDLRRFSSTVVEIESRFIEITDAFVQNIGADLRGLGGVAGSLVDLDDTVSAIGTDPEASEGLDNLGSGTTSASDPSAGIFFNDNSDGDIRARTENFFSNPLGQILSTVGGGSFQFSLLDDTELNLVLDMVEKSANATEIMAPVLTVYNTERAYVTVVNEISFLQDFDVDVAATAFIANPEIGILQEGIVLDVRPTISYDRKYITLEVRSTIAELVRPMENFETTLGGFTDPVTFQIPRLMTQNANTTVRVPDGGSVILGGLKTIRNINRQATSPWLGKIPIIGFFWREKGVVDEVSSLAIVVRANIRDLSKFRDATPLR